MKGTSTKRLLAVASVIAAGATLSTASAATAAGGWDISGTKPTAFGLDSDITKCRPAHKGKNWRWHKDGVDIKHWDKRNRYKENGKWKYKWEHLEWDTEYCAKNHKPHPNQPGQPGDEGPVPVPTRSPAPGDPGDVGPVPVPTRSPAPGDSGKPGQAPMPTRSPAPGDSGKPGQAPMPTRSPAPGQPGVPVPTRSPVLQQ